MVMRLLLLVLTAVACVGQIAGPIPAIPRVWDQAAMNQLDLPLATRGVTPRYLSASYYYSIPELVIYKSYPSRPPSGMPDEQYLDWLRKQEPEIAFDPASLHTQQDWIKAGEMVFYAPMSLTAAGTGTRRNTWRPWFIRTKGQLEKGPSACASCHVQVREDGTLVPGAPGGAGTPGQEFRTVWPKLEGEQLAAREAAMKRDFAAPWLNPDPNANLELVPLLNLRNGMLAREGTSFLSPQAVPDLIGIRDRKYLDHTGLEQHRSLVDLMRYAALNTNGASIQMLGSYGGFVPGGVDFKTLPDPKTLVRYSDAQLYALALFIYSLEPPPNPNKPSALSRRGEEIFRNEGCVDCHTPPLYTNNKLTPAIGFHVPEEDKKSYDILPVVVGTDPFLAMKTRRGTGYYKVPSLKGVWYRGPFEHNGSVATLEDWFDERRLQDDYVPTGFKGPGPVRAVKGHEFGVKLPPADKKALIVFLMTL
jgi:hypothetical protein